MKIRTATLQDLAAVTALEAACFPAAEAAPEASFRARLETYPESFWVMTDEADRPVAMVNGMCTDTPDLHDEMYENATLHDRAGEWQMIFGVATHPEHRKKGYAGQLLQTAIAASRARGKKGLVLTCKDRLVAYYAKFGFADEGMSDSNHGGVAWHQMRVRF